MNFEYPFLLYALFLVVIPVIIHFFNFVKPKKVYFTNVRLLREISTESKSRNRLKDILVMFARMAFIAAIVIAFAQPYFLDSSIHHDTKESVITGVYIDNSLSTQNDKDGKSVFNWEIDGLNKLLSSLPKSEKVFFYDNDYSVYGQVSTQKAQDKLTEITYSSNFRTVDEVIKRFKNDLGDDKKGKLYVFSDFQKTASQINSIDSLIQIVAIPVETKYTGNISIDSVWMDIPLFLSSAENKIAVRIRNHGKESISDVNLKFNIDGNRLGTLNIDVEPLTFKDVVFPFNITTSKPFYFGSMEIEDFPITFDDKYDFVLRPLQQINTHIISDGKSITTDVLEGETIFKLSHSTPSSPDYNALTKSDFIIIDGIEKASTALVTEVIEKVQKGSGALFLPFDSTSSLSTISYFDLKKVTSYPLFKSDLKLDIESELFKGVFQDKKKISAPWAKKVLDISGNSQTLISFSEGSPFLVHKRIDKGNIVVSSSPWKKEYTSLVRHSLIVPILYRSIFNSISSDLPLSFRLGNNAIRYQVDSIGFDDVIVLKKAEIQYIPQQRIVGKEVVMDFSQSKLDVGNYLVSSKKGLDLGGIAFVHNKKESEFEFASKEEYSGLAKQLIWVDINALLGGELSSKEITSGKTLLWKLFIWMALLFLLFEIVLIRLLKRK